MKRLLQGVLPRLFNHIFLILDKNDAIINFLQVHSVRMYTYYLCTVTSENNVSHFMHFFGQEKNML